MVVTVVLSFLDDVDDNGIAFLADQPLQFLVVVAVHVNFPVFVEGDIFRQNLQTGFCGTFLTHFFIITFQARLHFGVRQVFSTVISLVVVESAVVAQDQRDIHALHGRVRAITEAHVSVFTVEHHVGGFHIFQNGLDEGKAKIIVGILGFSHVGFSLGDQLIPVSGQTVFAKAEIGGFVRGVVVQGLFVFRSLIISLILCS